MPTSVLLAILAAAVLLLIAPALTRTDATGDDAEDGAVMTARVISRRRRRRTVPGRAPAKPPRFAPSPRSGPAPASSAGAHPRFPTSYKISILGGEAPRDDAFATGLPITGSGGAVDDPMTPPPLRRRYVPSQRPNRPPQPRRRRRPVPLSLRRRRLVLAALVLLNAVELAGVLLVGPGYLVTFSVSFGKLLADLVYLRLRAVADARLRLARQRRGAWVAAQQAAVRREHQRRAAERWVAARPPASGSLRFPESTESLCDLG